jgi:hypothetical protein
MSFEIRLLHPFKVQPIIQYCPMNINLESGDPSFASAQNNEHKTAQNYWSEFFFYERLRKMSFKRITKSYGVPFRQLWFFYFVLTRDARWYDSENSMVRWHDDKNTTARWWNLDGSMVKSRRYDGENAMLHRFFTIVLSRHRDFTIVPSCFHRRSIAFSPSYNRVLRVKTK